MSSSLARSLSACVFLLGISAACSGIPGDEADSSDGDSDSGVDNGSGASSIGSGGGDPVGSGAAASTGGSSVGTGAQASSGGTADGPKLGGTREEVQAACDPAASLDLGVTKLRRLTRAQLNNSIRDLFGDDARDYAAVLPPDETVGPFHSNSIAPVTDLIVQQLSEIASTAATDALLVSTDFIPCDLQVAADVECVTQVIQALGARAFRRPVTQDEQDALLALYTLGRDGTGHERGLEMLLRAILQSGSFLYLADTAQSGAVAEQPEPASAHTLASRLSYFLWNTIPDEQLQAVADDGSLSEDEVYLAQVERMLKDPRARDAIALFHERWLDVSEVPEKEKDGARYPEFNVQLGEEMLEEQAEFVAHVVLDGDGLLSTLFSSKDAYPSSDLASVYGVTAPVDGDSVTLPSEERGGLLTRAAFLTAHARSLDSSPVHRGIVVREHILCETIPPPPAGVSTDLPPKTEATTTREQFAQHLANPLCANCHSLIDPIGLAFEHYDAIGRFRALDGTAEIDARGEVLESGDDVAGEFDGVMELSEKLGQSIAVSDCVARQWFRFALSRVESASDACSMLSLFEGFEASGGDVRALMTQIALSDAFRNVRLTGGISQ